MNTADLLADNAARRAGHPALVFEDCRYSYGDLERRACRVANALYAAGVGKGDRIGLYAGNCPQWIEVFFAASKIGAVLVPIDFRLHRRELQDIAVRAEPRLLIFDGDLVAEVDGARRSFPDAADYVRIGAPAVPWAIEYAAWTGAAGDEWTARAEVTGRDLHSICFTSGTTESRKGALLTHDNVVVGTHRMSVDNLGYGRDDVFLSPLSLSHRAGWARLIQSVGVGATLVLMPRFDPEGTLEQIVRHRATFIGLVPTMVRAILADGARAPFDGSSVTTVMTMGEACPPPLKQEISRVFPAARLVTTFASTETGLIAALADDDHRRHPAAAGKPLPGVEIRILDDGGAELPRGEVGEITVRTGGPGTAGVMLAYLDDAGDAAGGPRDGWFRTGDCGYVDSHGYLYLSDRKKDIILSGALNISSREVETCLLEHPAVAEAAVVAMPDPDWGEAVAAFVVRRPAAEVTADELVGHCRERLASYKKPRAIRFVDRLPRNALGKVLKYKLRESVAAAAAAVQTNTGTRGP